MIWELIHTSAPRGLSPGSRGFTTVAQTKGMPAWLSETLERLSAYRSVSDASRTRGGQSPIVYRHARLVRGSESYSVLSRIAPCSDDYSGRSNRIAHHLVLDGSARDAVPAGPLWLFSHHTFCKEWTENPRHLPSTSPPPKEDVQAQPCRSWERATGDAGWAGEVLRRVLAQPSRGVYLRYLPDDDLLEMLNEASALLPPQLRWSLTFQVGSMDDPPTGMDCVLRCVPLLPGIPNRISGMGAQNTIDLSAGEAVSDSAYADSARLGEAIESEQPRLAGGGEKLIVSPAPGQRSLQQAAAAATSDTPSELLRSEESEVAEERTFFRVPYRAASSGTERRARKQLARTAALACMIGVIIGVPIGRLSFKKTIESSDQTKRSITDTRSVESRDGLGARSGEIARGPVRGSARRGIDEGETTANYAPPGPVTAKEEAYDPRKKDENNKKVEEPSGKDERKTATNLTQAEKGSSDAAKSGTESERAKKANPQLEPNDQSRHARGDRDTKPSAMSQSDLPDHERQANGTIRIQLKKHAVESKDRKNIEFDPAIVAGSGAFEKRPKEWLIAKSVLQIAWLATNRGSEVEGLAWAFDDDHIVERSLGISGAGPGGTTDDSVIAKVTANWNEANEELHILVNETGWSQRAGSKTSSQENDSNNPAGFCLLNSSGERAVIILWELPRIDVVDLRKAKPADAKEDSSTIFEGDGAIQVAPKLNGHWNYGIDKRSHFAEFSRESDNKVLFRVRCKDPDSDKPKIRVFVAANSDIDAARKEAEDNKQSTPFLEKLLAAVDGGSEPVTVPNMYGVPMLELVFFPKAEEDEPESNDNPNGGGS